MNDKEMPWVRLAIGLVLFLASAARADEPSSVPTETHLEFPLPKSMPRPEGDFEALPIDWPAVLELARATNLDIELATEKVNEANVNLSLARQQWLPSLRIGTSWLHHDGRIQDIPGNILDASKSSLFAGGGASLTLDPQKVAIDVLKAKQLVYALSGSLDRATRETLQQTSQAYLDLAAAQAGAAISMEVATLIESLVRRSEELFKTGQMPEVDVLQNRVQVQSQLQILNNASQNQLAASARLVMLLNLQPGTRLFAADDRLVPVTLIDESRPEKDLLEQALRQGPGLAEVASLISTLEQQERQLRRIWLMPAVSVDLGLGSFGGGFGGEYDNFGQRTDYGVNVYWDVLKVVGTAHTRELFESKRRQATLQNEQLTAKLATGVVVARNGARKARERIDLAEKEIETAIRSYEFSKLRLEKNETRSIEVLQAIAALGKARANYLAAVIDFNTFQITLQYLIGYEECAETDHEPPAEGGTSSNADPVTEPASTQWAATRRPNWSRTARSATVEPVEPVDPEIVALRSARRPMIESSVIASRPKKEKNRRRAHPREAYAKALQPDPAPAPEAQPPEQNAPFLIRMANSVRRTMGF